ncbi:hypothetical protein [Hymenobacter elongatus]|uniref:Uncharacterized protein n=1 Tax=Hymenobacter elongatus TaxID=877208 RepID=A0A4Z0PLI8_9BACT|nr:hypothetical protein [Hymenobacter elongatus]TGE16273.1 hypothetical protein E5J99_10350 [Hymenobacter elongatus]
MKKSISSDCDQEVLRVLQKQPNLWVPAIYRGRPTDAQFYQLVKLRFIEGSDYLYQLKQKDKHTWQDGTQATSPQPHYVQEVTLTLVDSHGR